jgi:hypothetical protein
MELMQSRGTTAMNDAESHRAGAVDNCFIFIACRHELRKGAHFTIKDEQALSQRMPVPQPQTASQAPERLSRVLRSTLRRI